MFASLNRLSSNNLLFLSHQSDRAVRSYVRGVGVVLYGHGPASQSAASSSSSTPSRSLTRRSSLRSSRSHGSVWVGRFVAVIVVVVVVAVVSAVVASFLPLPRPLFPPSLFSVYIVPAALTVCRRGKCRRRSRRRRRADRSFVCMSSRPHRTGGEQAYLNARRFLDSPPSGFGV